MGIARALLAASLAPFLAACGEDTDPAPRGDPEEVFGRAAAEDWPTYRGSTYREGYAAGSTVGDEVELLFQRDSFLKGDWTAVKPSAAVWGDALYFPDDMGTLFAFDRLSGDESWSIPIIERDPGIHGSPQVTKRSVCIGEYTGGLHCFDRETQERMWTVDIGVAIGSSPLYVEEHAAFYVSHETHLDGRPGGLVTKNDPFTGHELWRSVQLGDFAHSSVAVDPDRKMVLVGSNNGVLHAFDSDDGSVLWQANLKPDDALDDWSGDIKATPAISPSRGLVVVGSWDHHVYAFDLRDGSVRWSFDTKGRMQGSATLDEENGVVFQGSLVHGESLFALNLDTGDLLWSRNIGPVASSPSLSGDRGRVVVGSSNRSVIALEADSGEVVWTFDTDGDVSSSPVLAGREVYVAARLGSLYALRTR